jgi:hypothetical protein
MRKLHQLLSETQLARKRRRIRRGHHRIGKVERARRASFSKYKRIMSARPVDRA